MVPEEGQDKLQLPITCKAIKVNQISTRQVVLEIKGFLVI